jgi:hypothetical protein
MVLTHQSIIQLIFLHLSSLYPAEPSNPHHLIIIIILQFYFRTSSSATKHPQSHPRRKRGRKPQCRKMSVRAGLPLPGVSRRATFHLNFRGAAVKGSNLVSTLRLDLLQILTALSLRKWACDARWTLYDTTVMFYSDNGLCSRQLKLKGSSLVQYLEFSNTRRRLAC